MQPEKKQLENLLIQYFRESYNDFPKGQVVPSESPDFIVKMKSRNLLGIELTRLNPANAPGLDEQGKNHVTSLESFIELAKGLFEQQSSLKLFVKFLFSGQNGFIEKKGLSMAVKTVHIIHEAVKGRKASSFFQLSIQPHLLPGGISELLIAHHPSLEQSMWERSNNLGVSNDVVDDIRQTIQKKDEKLRRLYQKQHLNYYWLLITTDRLRGVKNFNLANKIVNHSFESHFQHVFLFDLIKSNVFQLV